MVDMARFFLDFTKKESCGSVRLPNRTKRMLEILEESQRARAVTEISQLG